MNQKKTIQARMLALTGLLAAVSCGGEEGTKAKVAIDNGDEKAGSFDQSISLAGSGNYTEVRTINTPHPYRNNYTNRWEVVGSADAIEMKVSFTRFELENGYDFITVTDSAGGQRTQTTGDKSGTDLIVTGNRVIITMTSDYSVTGWGASISVSERLPCRCIESYVPVCGADGRTYANACMAACDNVGVSAQGECLNIWHAGHVLIESEHPYKDDYQNTWTIREAGATRLRAHFSRIDIERGYDFVTILDASDRVIASYTGTQDNVTTPEVSGDTMQIRFTSDYSVTGFGFVLDSFEAQGGCQSDADCGAGMGCAQTVCIRAPCFNTCYPLDGGYTTMSTADLRTNAARYNGQRVRVVSEPQPSVAACTRIGCSPENPCCNQCNAHFTIEGDIYIDGHIENEFSCSGNSCNWESNCTPFRGTNAGPYELDGTFHVDQNGTMRIVVDAYRAANCARQGCGGNMCANGPVFSACVERPEDACFDNAECRAQGDGHCGFTQTESLAMCIASFATPAVLTSADTPLRIPDNSATGVTSSIVVAGQTRAMPVRVNADVTHTYRGDLFVVVIAPNGVETILHNRTGGSYDNLSIRDVALGSLEGAALNGTWRLVVRDRDAQDVGTLDRWSITLN